MPNEQQLNRRLWWCLLAAVVVAGIILRVWPLASRGLEYDELWTAEHYATRPVGDIFHDLTVPNNHPLHSLAVGLSLHLFGISTWSIRLPAFIAGCALLLVLPWLLWSGKRPFVVIVLATAWLAFMPDIVHYSQTARGYSLQILWLVLHAGLLWLTFMRLPLPPSRIWCSIIFLCGIAAILTIPAAILCLAPMTALHFLALQPWQAGRMRTWLWCRQHLSILLTHLATLGCAVLWLAVHAGDLAQGQQHGVTILSWQAWWAGCTQVACELFAWPWLLLALISLAKRETRAAAAGWLVLVTFVVLTVPVFKLGPTRVYTYLLPFFLVAASEGVEAIRQAWKKPQGIYLYLVASALAALPLIWLPQQLRRLEPTDWSKLVPMLDQKLGNDSYLLFPVWSGYPMRYSCMPAIGASLLRRIPKGDRQQLVMVEDCRQISGIRGEKNDTACIIIPATIQGQMSNEMEVQIATYPLYRQGYTVWPSQQEKLPGIWLLALGPAPVGQIEAAHSPLQNTWITLNTFLRLSYRVHGQIVRGKLLAAQDPLATPVQEVLRQFPQVARLYRLGD